MGARVTQLRAHRVLKLRTAITAAACAIGVALVPASPAWAVINDPDDDSPSEGPCSLAAYDFELEGNLAVVGVPLAGSRVQINASSAKLVGRGETAAHLCDPLLVAIPRLRWSVTAAPAGQSATITTPTTISPGVKLGGAGSYRVRLTACPNRCNVTVNGRTVNIGPLTLDVGIAAVAQFAPPPETEPLLPPLFAPGAGANPPGWSGPTSAPPRFTYAQRKAKCHDDGGVKDPQWVTVEPFAGTGSYRTVEGAVTSSRVSAADDFLNHDSEDHNWNVKPDPPYFGLPHPTADDEMEMEWETDSLPAAFRPTVGDRTSTIGYWIFDCGHAGFRGEIHPPVGIAVERPRAVSIPESFRPPGFPNGLGTGLQVPGIVADVYFSRTSGETTRNCSRTGLHSPSLTPDAQFPANRDFCVREPHPLGRSTFNVYLPRNPQERAQQLGLSPPAVPVFTGIEQLGLGRGGPEPTVVVRQGGGATWLEVTVDLTSLPLAQTKYARRITAAWAYPQPENWGARGWRVRLKSIDVLSDAEPFGDDGDWRFFFNTNNRDQEWTKVFSCDGCVDDGHMKSLNVETGSAAGSPTGLGPDLVLFPGQPILVHTGGFDEEVNGDDIGTVVNQISQSSGAGTYHAFSIGGPGSYTLNYAIGGGGRITPAVLTPEARGLLAAYTAGATPTCTLVATGGRSSRTRSACVISPALRDPVLTQRFGTTGVVLTRRVSEGKELGVYEHEREERTIQGISPANLKRSLLVMRRSDPKGFLALLAEIRAELATVPRALRGDYYDLVATLDRALPRPLVARALPVGFRSQIRVPRTVKTKRR